MITITDTGSPRLATAAQLMAINADLSEVEASTLIDQASAMIASACNRVLHQQTVTETYRGVRCGSLMLSRYPVASITSVVVDGETLSSDDYELDSAFLYRLSNDAYYAWHGTKIEVTYIGGYATEAIPHDLSRACLDLCVNLDATQGRDMTLRGVSIPDVENVSYRDPSKGGGLIPDHVMMVIDHYREVRL